MNYFPYNYLVLSFFQISVYRLFNNKLAHIISLLIAQLASGKPADHISPQKPSALHRFQEDDEEDTSSKMNFSSPCSILPDIQQFLLEHCNFAVSFSSSRPEITMHFTLNMVSMVFTSSKPDEIYCSTCIDKPAHFDQYTSLHNFADTVKDTLMKCFREITSNALSTNLQHPCTCLWKEIPIRSILTSD